MARPDIDADEVASIDPRRAVGALSAAGLRQLLTDRRRLAGLLPLAGWRWLLGLCAAVLLGASVPSMLAFVSGWLIESVLAVPDGSGLGALLPPLSILAAVLMAQQAAEVGHELFGTAVARRIDGVLRTRVRDLSLLPAHLDHLEDPLVHDDLSRVWDTGGLINRTGLPGTAAVAMVRLNARLLGVAAAAAVLCRFSATLGLGLLVTTLLVRAIGRRQWAFLTDVVDSRARYRRRAEAWSEFAAGPGTAKEVRLFGLGDWATRRRDDAALEWSKPIWLVRRNLLRRQGATVTLSSGSAFLALLVPGLAAASGEITVQSLVVYLVAAWGVFSASLIGPEAQEIERGLAAVRALDRLVARYTGHAGGNGGQEGNRGQGATPATGTTVAVEAPPVRFDGVGFRYPDAPRPVLEAVDLTIRPGEVLAIVGRNGAGKTTMIKLLAGLYQPTSGRILVDGHPLSDFDAHALASWRRRLAAVFQDFVHYPASLADNIALSAPDQLSDEERVRDAADRAGLGEIIAGLPAGLATPLFRDAPGGVDLSGGQWQRIAIARSLFAVAAGRQLLVLDEPTANLDVRAEARFFEQVIKEVNGASVVLISHRLSTVRHADRIVLLDDGRITESGSHEELLERDGDYARLFHLQASRFETAPEAS